MAATSMKRDGYVSDTAARDRVTRVTQPESFETLSHA